MVSPRSDTFSRVCAVSSDAAMITAAQSLDDLPDVLIAILVRHQNGVRRGDDNHILDADRGDQRPLAAKIGVPRVFGENLADDGVALRVLARQLKQRFP